MTKRSVPSPVVAPNLGVGRRLAPRVPAELACELAWDDGAVAGSVIDLSVGGAAIGIDEPLPIPDGARVFLQLETESGSVAVEASIVIQSEEAFGTFVARLKFIGGENAIEVQALVAHCVDSFRDSQAVVFRKHL